MGLHTTVVGQGPDVVPGVPHDFWSTHPEAWVSVVTEACRIAVPG